MDLAEIKRALRVEIRGRILAMSPAIREREERALVERFVGLPGLVAAQTVLLYASAFPEEFDTTPMLRSALDLGKRLLCPRVIRDEQRLALFEIADPGRDLVAGMKGIPEPRAGFGGEVGPGAVDWVLVPGLGYDAACHRIGRGAGHYDRLLTLLRPGVPRWSLCLTTQWVPELPVEPHDRRLDGVADAERLVSRS